MKSFEQFEQYTILRNEELCFVVCCAFQHAHPFQVVIPQSAKRLEDFSEEASIADQGKADEDVLMEEVPIAAPPVKPTEPQPEIRHQELSVTLDEDVLMVTKQLDDFADPR